ncbi:shikimate kinase [Miniphocaeibacter massiliensis]|uniref:shikimate kinase n=1 Tax=Miniphocaeibacter massiliensis TaxID=2041841 RepID=UPI000C1BB965|nr:shikimate kinase [Miniphocaeibacter massiliensis]
MKEPIGYGLLGAHLSYSFSPEIHKQFADYKYELFEKEESEIEEFLKDRNLKAINITIPYKKTVMKYCHHISDIAKRIDAINVIKFENGKLYADNTDYYGVKYMLKKGNIDVFGKRVAILGDGATSQTVKVVLEDLGASEILNISRKGNIKFDELCKYDFVEVIINCTPVGMYPGKAISLVDLKEFKKLEAIADVVYNPSRTAFILQGEELGINTINGLPMLVGQAKKAVEIFLNKEINEDKLDEVYKKIYKNTQNIILIGMPGSGKSSIGEKISIKLNRKFIDIDKEIERETKMTIPEIFQINGETGFRRIEKELTENFSKETGVVISTGGGVVLDKENYYSLKQNGYIVLIDRDLRKLSTKGRPLSQGGLNKLKQIKEERKKKYEEFSDIKIKNIYLPKTVDDILEAFDENSCN